MSFLDDLKNFLDSTLGAPNGGGNNPLASLGSGALGDLTPPEPVFSPEGPSATGISNSDLSDLETWPDPSRTPDVPGALAGIIQSRKNAFTVIDVTPTQFALSQPANNLNKIIEKTGIDADTNDLVVGVSVNSAWRVLSFGIAGNHFSFNFKMSPINKPSVQVSEALQQDLVNPNTLLKTPGGNFANGKLGGSWASSSIFVQFDDPNSPLMLVNEGDELNLVYTQVFVYFKWYSFPFSLIFGNGATYSRKSLSSFNPPFTPIETLNQKNRHCIPFCFTDHDQAPTGATTNLAASSNTSFNLFDPRNVAAGVSAPIGCAIGWIDSVIFSIFGNTTGNYGIDFLIQITGTGRSKLLVNIPICFSIPTTQNSQNGIIVPIDFSQPKRFTLWNDPGGPQPMADKLVAEVITSANPGSIAFKFTIMGYVYGNIGTVTPRPTTPFSWPLEMITNNPYPCDYAYNSTGI